jgi:hypothetical protein
MPNNVVLPSWVCTTRTLAFPITDVSEILPDVTNIVVGAVDIAAAVPVTANARAPGIPGAAEPVLYYVNPEVFPGDREFNMTFMAGNGNLVSK